MPVPTRWQAHGRYPYLLAKYASVAVLSVLVVVLLHRLSVVVIPIFFAGVLAYVLHGPMDFLVGRRFPRSVAASLLVFLTVVGVAALGLLLVPTLFVHVADLLGRLPLMLDAVDRQVAPFLEERFGMSLRLDRAAVTQALQAHAVDLAAPSGWVVSHIFSSALTLVLAAVNTVIVIVFAFYLLRSHDEIADRLLDLTPVRFRDSALLVARAVDEALAGFIRGQVSVCILMAALYATALSLFGVKGGAVIGLVTGIFNFVPYLGLATGLSLSLLSVGLDYSGPAQVIEVLATFAALPLLDATIITPNVVGNRVGLNPFVVIVSMLVGVELLGFVGLLLAVPTAAVLRALVRFWIQAYRDSQFYRGPAQDDAPGETGP